LPPIRATFVSLDSFDGPEYMLRDGVWIVMEDQVACGRIKLDKSSIHPELLESFPDLLEFEELVVFMVDITATNKWPVIIPKE
jgi:hypothetical protein